MKACEYTRLAGAIVGCVVAGSQWICAQPVPASPSPGPNRGKPLSPLLLPPLKSPVALFRELLAMGPADREQYFAGKKPEQRQAIESKLKEYESLSADERELRL